ncbi:MAG: hypothetical protein GF311_17640 [Candidatus Lokiarchaeota archaeon]|nr:hypothetical protein [Candidatus Lokiarchaeota archaeon]
MKMYLYLYAGNCSESFMHKAIKRLIFKYITKNCSNIKESSLEKHFGSRRADVYFKLYTGEEIAVEIQNSYISVKEVMDRTIDYNKKGVYVLWILNGKGNAVGSRKFPENRRDMRISPVENILHSLYGGRVYYVNVNEHSDYFAVTTPYALHFSPSKKKSIDIYKGSFEYFFIRDVNYMPIPSWDLLCIDYRFKIGRFYDQNLLNRLIEHIDVFLEEIEKRKCTNCQKRFKLFRRCCVEKNCDFKPFRDKKLLKLIIEQFGNEYGSSIIFEALYRLTEDKDVKINRKYIKKGYNKYFEK